MRKNILIGIIAAVLAAGAVYLARPEKVVYTRKPQLTDTTLLRAVLPANVWQGMMNNVLRQRDRLCFPGATDEQRKAAGDSLTMTVNVILSAVNDSVQNPIFKK